MTDDTPSAELTISSEGVSVSLYDDLGLIDETWFTWAEIFDGMDAGWHQSFEDITAEMAPMEVTLADE